MNPTPSPRPPLLFPLAGLAAALIAVMALMALLVGCSDHNGKPMSAMAATTAPGAAGNAPRELAMARGKVEVQGGLLEVMASQDGVVDSLAVKEGDEVHRGQVLLKLAPEQAQMEVDMAQAELRLLQARQRVQTSRLPAARLMVQRTGEAARAGALDPQRADEALLTQHEIESAIAVIEAEGAVARQKLAQAQYTVRRQTLTAPVDASVLKLGVQTGSRVSTQATRPLLVLLPHRPLIVRAELNETYLANVKAGTQATISLGTDADGPGGTRTAALTARVVRLSPSFSTGRLDDESGARGSLRVVDCFLELDPAAASGLRLGQDVRVSFHE
ncbi:MAG: secretion protein HlyD [Rhodoferax sp.]|nr:secretion protein HlyD [Rhodoferax sp.]